MVTKVFKIRQNMLYENMPDDATLDIYIASFITTSFSMATFITTSFATANFIKATFITTSFTT